MSSTPAIASWVEQRKRTLVAVTIGAVTLIVVALVAWRAWPPVIEPDNRLAYAVQLAAGPALLLLLMNCACLRLFDTAGAENPFANAESARFRINQRVLTNTLEQTCIFVPLLLALTPRLDEAHLKVLPIAATLWCAGRVMFWAGYHVAPHWRSPGFDWTFCTSVVLAAWFVLSL
jgi:peptidoglycan/LPS O-acetylase OafA/YrhL